MVDCSVFPLNCVGPGTGSHIYLNIEGTQRCHKCKNVMCNTCKFIDIHDKEKTIGKETKVYCVSCIAEVFSCETQQITNLLTREEMVQSLTSVGMDIRESDDINVIIDLHDAVINNNQFVYNSENVCEFVSILEKPTTYLNEIEKISSIEIRNIAQYINDNVLTLKEKIEITSLLADLVKINSNQTEGNVGST